MHQSYIFDDDIDRNPETENYFNIPAPIVGASARTIIEHVLGLLAMSEAISAQEIMRKDLLSLSSDLQLEVCHVWFVASVSNSDRSLAESKTKRPINARTYQHVSILLQSLSSFTEPNNDREVLRCTVPPANATQHDLNIYALVTLNLSMELLTVWPFGCRC